MGLVRLVGSFVLPFILLMANKFKLGDVVQLKSGGPKMTVNQLLGADNQLLGFPWFLGTFKSGRRGNSLQEKRLPLAKMSLSK
jgi:uncharacterized protein YodC (DUF2158 family)